MKIKVRKGNGIGFVVVIVFLVFCLGEWILLNGKIGMNIFFSCLVDIFFNIS